MEKVNGVQLAINAVGGQKKTLAALLKVTPAAVSYWLRVGYIPPNKVREVSKYTGIPCHVLDDRFAAPAKK